MADLNVFLQAEVEVKRFFSFASRFPTFDREWTATYAVAKWLHIQTGDWWDNPIGEEDEADGDDPHTAALRDLAESVHKVDPAHDKRQKRHGLQELRKKANIRFTCLQC